MAVLIMFVQAINVDQQNRASPTFPPDPSVFTVTDAEKTRKRMGRRRARRAERMNGKRLSAEVINRPEQKKRLAPS